MSLRHSKRRDDRFACDALMVGYGPEDRIECTYSEKVMIRNRYTLMRRRFCFKNNVAAGFMDSSILSLSAEGRSQAFPGDVAGQFHATDSTSSLTR
jgi:hypothetical protein